MIRTAAWSLIGGGLLTAGAAYLYSRRSQRRLGAAPPLAPLQPAVGAGDLELPIFDEGLLLSESEIDVEIVDIDTLSGQEDPDDAPSPDDLGAVWLARATQTAGEHTSGTSQVAGSDWASDDDLDPAGRPTDPPEDVEVDTR